MALTITEQPTNFANVHNTCAFVVYESVKANDPITYVDYKYVADIYVGATLIARLRAVPDPIKNAGIFEVNKLLVPYMPTNLPGEYNIIRLGYSINFGEEYNNTLYTNVLVGATKYVFNSYNQPQRINGGAALYGNNIIYASSNSKRIVNVSEQGLLGEQFMIPIYQPNVNVEYEIQTFTNDGAFVAAYVGTELAAGVYNIIPFNMNKANVASFVGATEFDYAILSIVTLQDIRVNYTCYPRQKNYRIAFLNKYGAFESFDFSLVHKETINVNRKTFRKKDYYITDSRGRNFNYGNTNIYSVKATQKIKITSDYLDDETFNWLRELATSPAVYLTTESNEWTLITPMIDTYNVNNNEADGLKVMELEFELDYYNTQQL